MWKRAVAVVAAAASVAACGGGNSAEDPQVVDLERAWRTNGGEVCDAYEGLREIGESEADAAAVFVDQLDGDLGGLSAAAEDRLRELLAGC